ncbi:MAG: HAD family hydrolase [Bacilli bacterium]|nr:HAD family hydrolase [Bacilli bacterium]
MIKKIIFDLDNTLIMWKNEYWNSLNETLNELNLEYDCNTIEKLKEAVNNYELVYDKYDKILLKQIMEKYINYILPDNFVDTWLIHLEKCCPKKVADNIIETLDYLSKKYELVVLTNWFTKPQIERLKNAKILNYFNEVIGTDKNNILNKPNEISYISSCYPHQFNECLMIGDNEINDFLKPQELGMKAILYDYQNKYEYINKIQNIKQLKEIL